MLAGVKTYSRNEPPYGAALWQKPNNNIPNNNDNNNACLDISNCEGIGRQNVKMNQLKCTFLI